MSDEEFIEMGLETAESLTQKTEKAILYCNKGIASNPLIFNAL